ncbi:MAG: hypothetical protein AAF587_24820 [Bacteroidota bacterium]
MKQWIFFVLLFCLIQGLRAQEATLFSPVEFSELDSVEIRKLFRASKHDIWIGTKGKGIFRWREDHLAKLTSNQEGFLTGFIAIEEDADANIWFGARGMMSINGESCRVLSEEVSSTVIFSFTIDRKGNLYAGGNRGFHQYSKKKEWLEIPASKQLNHQVVHDLIVDKNQAWIATRKGGLNYIKKGKLLKSFLTESNCRKLLQLNNRDILVGTNNGVFRINPKDELSTLVAGKLLLPEFEDAKGDIWFSSEREGIIKYDGKQWWRIANEGVLTSQQVFTIIDVEEELWLGTNAGLQRLSKAEIPWQKMNL